MPSPSSFCRGNLTGAQGSQAKAINISGQNVGTAIYPQPTGPSVRESTFSYRTTSGFGVSNLGNIPSFGATLISRKALNSGPHSRASFQYRQVWPRFALANFRLRPIDHKARHSIEESPKDLLGLSRQRSFPKSTVHQAHPSVTGSLIYRERGMPGAEARMSSLFDVSL